MEEDQFARRKRLLEEEAAEKLHEENVKKFKEQKRTAKRKNEHPAGKNDSKRIKVSAIGGEVSHQQTSVTVPTDGDSEHTVPDNGKPAVGGEASLQQTSFAVPTDGKGDTKIPESEEPAGRNTTVQRRRMETEKTKVLEYINNKN